MLTLFLADPGGIFVVILAGLVTIFAMFNLKKELSRKSSPTCHGKTEETDAGEKVRAQEYVITNLTVTWQ